MHWCPLPAAARGWFHGQQRTTHHDPTKSSHKQASNHSDERRTDRYTMGLLVVLSLLSVAWAEETIYVRCGSRAKEGPLTREGIPTQFVHIPKCAGLTMQNLILANIGVNNTLRAYVAEEALAQDMVNGSYYAGHRPLGWGSLSDVTSLKRPLFMTVLREPVARLISLYDFFLEQAQDDHRLAQSLFEKEQQLVVSGGINATSTMDEMLRLNFWSLMLFARRSAEYLWLLPDIGDDDCPDTVDSLAVAVNNLLRVDIVAVAERFVDVGVQIQYHAPHLDLETLNRLLAEKVNVAPRPKQVLSKASIDKLRTKVETVVFDIALYEAASTVAEARTKRATDCLESPENCQEDDFAVCPLTLPADVSNLLNRALDLPVNSCARRRLVPDAWLDQDELLLLSHKAANVSFFYNGTSTAEEEES